VYCEASNASKEAVLRLSIFERFLKGKLMDRVMAEQAS
jgi:hypothetical protein